MSISGVISLLFLVIVLVILLLIANADSNPPQPVATPTGIILVSDGPPENVGLYDDVFAVLPRAETAAELEAMVDDSTKAIVIDPSVASSLSSEFLSEQLASGVHFFALNTSHSELFELAGGEEACGRAGCETGLAIYELGSAPVSSYYSYLQIDQRAQTGGDGRLDAVPGGFLVRLGRAVGYSCDPTATSWDVCQAP